MRRLATFVAASGSFFILPTHVPFQDVASFIVAGLETSGRWTSYLVAPSRHEVSPRLATKSDRWAGPSEAVSIVAGSGVGSIVLEPTSAGATEPGRAGRGRWPEVNRSQKGDYLASAFARQPIPVAGSLFPPDRIFAPVSRGDGLLRQFTKLDLDRLKIEDIVGPALAIRTGPPPKVVAAFAPVAAGVMLQGKRAVLVPPPAPKTREEAERQKRTARARAAIEAGGLPGASLRCLSEAVYFEARGESEEGQAAVAQVVLNRVHTSHYPDTVCEVVYQNRKLRNRCQFSFACDGHPDRIRNSRAWRTAQRVAKAVADGEIWLPDVGYATHYHATYVKPRWIRDMVKQDKIGRHIFYRVRWWKNPHEDEDQDTSVAASGQASTPAKATLVQPASVEVPAPQPAPQKLKLVQR